MTQTVPHFEGRPRVEWPAGNGRAMQLIEPFVFVDKTGYRWEVFKGTIIDGSSVPRILWPIIGSPYCGLHREASIPHDLYCRIRIRSCEDTHRMYYNAMLVAGVPSGRARRKYNAVQVFGPRW